MGTSDTIARIRAYMAAERLSKNGLAGKAGLNESTIRFIDAPDWNPTADTLKKLEAIIPEDFAAEPKEGKAA